MKTDLRKWRICESPTMKGKFFMKKVLLMVAAALLTGSMAVSAMHLAKESGSTEVVDIPTEVPQYDEISDAYSDSEEETQNYEDNILILMKSEDCTDGQLAKILEKYHLTLLCEGNIIPFCTVQLEKSMTEQELEAIADTIMEEDGILSATLSYIVTIS